MGESDHRTGFGRRDDLVRPPSFHDGIARTPLEADNARWHGARAHSITLASVIAIAGAAVAISLMVALAPSGAAPESLAPGASAVEDPGFNPQAPEISGPAPGVLNNVTSSIPPPLPP